MRRACLTSWWQISVTHVREASHLSQVTSCRRQSHHVKEALKKHKWWKLLKIIRLAEAGYVVKVTDYKLSDWKIGYNLESVRCEIRGTVRNRKWEYLKENSNEQKPNNNDKSIGVLYEGINRTNMIKCENGDLHKDMHSKLKSRKITFFLGGGACWLNDVKAAWNAISLMWYPRYHSVIT